MPFALRPGADQRTEGSMSMSCGSAASQLNMFEEMVLLMSPLSPEADGLCD